jgi:hypothetical protein
VGRPEPGAGEHQTPGDETAGDGDKSVDQGESGEVDGLGGEQGGPSGDRGEGHADHPRAVFLADSEDGEDDDYGLAEVDSGQGELGGILPATARGPVGGGGDDRAGGDGERGGAGEQPRGRGQGAQLGPLSLYGRRPRGAQLSGRGGAAVGCHASLRRSR